MKPAKDFPVDLYYLMDMSKSMEDDLVQLRSLGDKIGLSLPTSFFNNMYFKSNFYKKLLSTIKFKSRIDVNRRLLLMMTLCTPWTSDSWLSITNTYFYKNFLVVIFL